jgi:hypothetical protein
LKYLNHQLEPGKLHSVRGLALGFLLLVPLLQAREAPLPDPETMRRLGLGEIVTESARIDEKGGAVEAIVMIWAPVEDIWATIYSCESAFIYLKGLRVCEVLEDDGVDTLTHHVLKQGWHVPRQDYNFRTHRAPFTRADISLVEGNLKSMNASWEYIGLPEAVVVIYKVRVQPGFPVPRLLVRRSLKKGTQQLLACVRGLSGGSKSPRQEAKDLDRCPGDIEQAPVGSPLFDE